MMPGDLHEGRAAMARDYAAKLPAGLRELFYRTLGHRLANLPNDTSRKKFRKTCVDVFLALVPEAQYHAHKINSVDHPVTPLQISRTQLDEINSYARRISDDAARDKFFSSVARELRCTMRRPLSREDFQQIVVDCFFEIVPHVTLEVAL